MPFKVGVLSDIVDIAHFVDIYLPEIITFTQRLASSANTDNGVLLRKHSPITVSVVSA